MSGRTVRTLRSTLIALGPLLGSVVAHAQPDSAPPAHAPPPGSPPVQSEPDAASAIARAKDLHRRGLAMLETSDNERALEFFRQSRSVYPSAKNIANEAICLQRLGRFDEALDVYETLLTQYAKGLSAEDREALGPIIRSLRQKIGRLWPTSTVEGAVVLVDGRKRTTLPAQAPIRVLPGKRRVRVLKPGYDVFETVVDVRLGETANLDAKLAPLAEVGVLRVEDEGGEAATVFVDGVEMGPTPWEGLVRPGAHLVWTRREDLGSDLEAVTIVEGQVTLIRARTGPLGPLLIIHAEPVSARIQIDDIDVGTAAWEGRLPVGEHTIKVVEEGYQSESQQWSSRQDAEPTALTVRLPIDEDHPRWPSAFDGNFWLEAYGGYTGTNRIGAGAEDDCPSHCSAGPVAHGFIAGARAGYRFPLGVSLELGGGYLWFQGMVERTIDERYGPSDEYAVRYDLEDAISVRGPFVAPSASWRLGLSERFHLTSRLTVGIFFSVASDEITGTARAYGQHAPVLVAEAEPERQVTLFVMPELGVGTRLGPVDLGLALGVAYFPLEGPVLPARYATVQPNPNPTGPQDVSTAQGTDAIANERAWASFMLWVPQLSLGYTFE